MCMPCLHASMKRNERASFSVHGLSFISNAPARLRGGGGEYNVMQTSLLASSGAGLPLFAAVSFVGLMSGGDCPCLPPFSFVVA